MGGALQMLIDEVRSHVSLQHRLVFNQATFHMTNLKKSPCHKMIVGRFIFGRISSDMGKL